MNERYLFRGKRGDNKERVEGDLMQWNDGTVRICIESGENEKTATTVIPETVGQCTGLKDKNGKLIFEGDIVKGNSEYFAYTHPYGRVVYDGGQFLISFDDALEDIECLGAWANAVEVIGDIHDNPELLESDTE